MPSGQSGHQEGQTAPLAIVIILLGQPLDQTIGPCELLGFLGKASVSAV